MKTYLRNQMHEIYNLWDYHLREKLEGADHIVRVMTGEMGQLGIPKAEYIPFLQQKFGEMIQTIAREG